MSSYGVGKPAPDDCIDVGLQSSYDTLKSVPVHEAGPRKIGDINQTPQNPPSEGGYATPYGSPVK